MNTLNLSKDDGVKLKPCPFCGVELYACTYDGGKTRYAHEVNGCVISRTFVQGQAKEAAWNRRHNETPSEYDRLCGRENSNV